MKISIPELIDEDEELLFSNLPEDSSPEYDSQITYQPGDVVILEAYHRKYEAIVEVTGIHPLDGVNLEPPVWLDIGSTNRWAMFDGEAGTITSSAFPIETVIQPDTPVDNLAMFGVEATSVLCEVYMSAQDPSTDTPVFSQEKDLVLDPIHDFDPVEYQNDFIFENLPASEGMKLRVVITPVPGESARCALAVPGRMRTMGCTQYGMSLGILDYSRVDRDDFGRPFIVRRRFSKLVSANLEIKNEHVDRIHKSLSQYRASPIVWVFTDMFASSIVYGFYRDFGITVDNFTFSSCNLEVEGLI